MVYIYKKIINGKAYYYLRISKNLNGKVLVKDIAYLGNKVSEIEKKLDNLKKYQKEIRKGYKNIQKFLNSNYYLEKAKKKKLKKDDYLEKERLEQIEAIKLHYNQSFLKLDKLTIDETYKHFLIDFAFNTTSIEGNTITLKEANRLLKEEILPKNKTLREVYDLQNTEKVFLWLLKNKPVINEKLIIKIHDELLGGIDVRKGYRNQEIRIIGSRFDVSPAKYIQTDMKILMKWFDKNKSKLHPFVLSVLLHHKLERIHPFADGNGRTGRMLMNYFLIRNKYPPFIVSKKRRSDYLNALNKADKSDLNDIGPKSYNNLIIYLAEEIIASYWNNFNI